MRILFLTRVHPPIVGGLENQSYNLIKNFKKINKDTFTIINRKGKKNLPFFIPYSFFKALYVIKKNKITHMHLSDGVLTFEGYLLKKLTGVKTFVTVHGLDLTFENSLHQKFNVNNLKKLDKIICISENTKNICISKGIPKNKCVIIPNGINTGEFIINKNKKELKSKLFDKLHIDLNNKKILITTGRLVARKGVNWFVNNIMPKLGSECIYLVVGDGEEKAKIKNSIKENNLNEKVHLLGKVDFQILKEIYNIADLFIMPNITIKGDVEGFGLVAIEAGSCGVSVITSGIEGIKGAIINGETGWIVGEKNIEGFLDKINNANLNKEKVKKTIKENYSWEKIVEIYEREMF